MEKRLIDSMLIKSLSNFLSSKDVNSFHYSWKEKLSPLCYDFVIYHIGQYFVEFVFDLLTSKNSLNQAQLGIGIQFSEWGALLFHEEVSDTFTPNFISLYYRFYHVSKYLKSIYQIILKF